MVPYGFRPTLAYKVTDFEEVRYPVVASPKIDGIRCVVFDAAFSRTLKPIRNNFVQHYLQGLAPAINGFDGELIVPGGFSNVSSSIMSEDGEPDFEFHVFDYFDSANPSKTYLYRIDALRGKVDFLGDSRIKLLLQTWIADPQELARAEVRALREGYEGLMIREPKSPYKFGRSTLKEGYLGKIKRFFDAEAEVIGFECLRTNENPQTINRLGLAERAKDQSLLVEQELLGKLICRDLNTNREFGIGTGFSARQRDLYWKGRDGLIGQIVRYKHLPYGALELPRHPVFIAFRHPEDL